MGLHAMLKVEMAAALTGYRAGDLLRSLTIRQG